MSIENNLASIAKSLETIATIMSATKTEVAHAPAVAAAPVVTPVVAPLPVVTPVPAAVFVDPMSVVTAAPVAAHAPVAEVIQMPVAAPAGAAPFNDAKGLTEYCMNKYRTLGPVKGGMIQEVLNSLGATSIHNLSADKYAEFYSKVEAL